jgi:general secretion pathway protein M
VTLALSPAGRRLAAIGLLLLALLALWAGLVAPALAAWNDAAAAREAAIEQLARYRQRAVSKPALARELELQRANTANTRGAWTGENPTLVSAKLQAELKRLIAGRGGQLRSTQALAPGQVEGFNRIAVQVDFSLAVDALPRLLHDIETTQPYLFIDNLVIRGDELGPAGGNREPRLTVRCDVLAFMRSAS